jgi:hypothetical protein
MSFVRSALIALAATVVIMSTPVLTAAAAATAHDEVKGRHVSKGHQTKDHHQTKDRRTKGPETGDHHSTKAPRTKGPRTTGLRTKRGGATAAHHRRDHHEAPVNDDARSQQKPETQRRDNIAPGDAANWSDRDWSRATADWARKNKDKWSDCQKQSKDQGLAGRRNRSFLAACMST